MYSVTSLSPLILHNLYPISIGAYSFAAALAIVCVLVIIPVEGIRLLDAVRLLLGRQKKPCLLQRCGLSLVSSAPKK